jgi:hypothetical protein
MVIIGWTTSQAEKKFQASKTICEPLLVTSVILHGPADTFTIREPSLRAQVKAPESAFRASDRGTADGEHTL